MKTCSRCKEQKDLSDFNLKGIGKFQPYCRLCDNETKREHYLVNKKYYYNKSKNQRKRNKIYIDQIKVINGCINCPEKDISCLDFHHIKEKTAHVSALINRGASLDKIKKEIEKCIIMCSNCHRKLHRDIKIQ